MLISTFVLARNQRKVLKIADLIALATLKLARCLGLMKIFTS